MYAQETILTNGKYTMQVNKNWTSSVVIFILFKSLSGITYTCASKGVNLQHVGTCTLIFYIGIYLASIVLSTFIINLLFFTCYIYKCLFVSKIVETLMYISRNRKVCPISPIWIKMYLRSMINDEALIGLYSVNYHLEDHNPIECQSGFSTAGSIELYSGPNWWSCM